MVAAMGVVVVGDGGRGRRQGFREHRCREWWLVTITG